MVTPIKPSVRPPYSLSPITIAGHKSVRAKTNCLGAARDVLTRARYLTPTLYYIMTRFLYLHFK